MPRIRSSRRSATFATLLAIGATTLFGGAGTAHATHAAPTPYLLTASNGTAAINTGGGAMVLSDEYTITDAAWGPDGSRAVFVADSGEIATIRWNSGDSVYPVADPPQPGVQRADPEWVGDGSTVVWAAKPNGQPWRIEETVSTYGFDVVRRSPNDGHHYSQPDTNGSQRIVVQRQANDQGNPTGTPEIGFLDGGTYTRIVTDAASPTLSPDGKRVAFVRGGQIWVSDTSGGNLVQITNGTAVHADPVWYPNNTNVAFRRGNGVAIGLADGTLPNPPLVSGLTGKPDVQPRNKDRVVRLAGTNRFTTAAAIARAHWASVNDAADKRARADAVVLSRSDTFADALGGSALAAAKQGPLLMTARTSLDPTAAEEMQRILAPGKTVYLLGSAAGAISADVEQQVRDLGFNPVRLAGTDRFSTSVAIANAIDPTPDTVLAATGMNFPDALSAGAAAGAQNLPGKGTSAVVVLTNDNRLPASIKSYLDGLPQSSVIAGVGLQGATATESYGSVPLYGDSRFQTALLTAWAFFGGQNHIGLSTGMNWPDALAGGALMASLDGPLLLTNGTAGQFGFEPWYLGDETSGSVHTGLIFGSAPVVNAIQVQGLGEIISGPAGYTSQTNSTDVYRSTGGTTAADKREAAAAVDGPRTRAELEAAVKAAKERLKK